MYVQKILFVALIALTGSTSSSFAEPSEQAGSLIGMWERANTMCAAEGDDVQQWEGCQERDAFTKKLIPLGWCHVPPAGQPERSAEWVDCQSLKEKGFITSSLTLSSENERFELRGNAAIYIGSVVDENLVQTNLNILCQAGGDQSAIVLSLSRVEKIWPPGAGEEGAGFLAIGDGSVVFSHLVGISTRPHLSTTVLLTPQEMDGVLQSLIEGQELLFQFISFGSNEDAEGFRVMLKAPVSGKLKDVRRGCMALS